MLLVETVGNLKRKVSARFMQVEVAGSTTVERTSGDDFITAVAVEILFTILLFWKKDQRVFVAEMLHCLFLML